MLPSCSTFRVISLQDLKEAFNSFCWRQKPLELLTFQKKNVVVKHENVCQEAPPQKKHVGYAFRTIFWTLGGIVVSLKTKVPFGFRPILRGNSFVLGSASKHGSPQKLALKRRWKLKPEKDEHHFFWFSVHVKLQGCKWRKENCLPFPAFFQDQTNLRRPNFWMFPWNFRKLPMFHEPKR